MRKLSAFREMTSRRNPPSTRIGSLDVEPGDGTSTRVVAEVGEHQIPQQLAAVRMRVRAHPCVALRGSAASSGTSRPRRRTAPPAGNCAAIPRAAHGGPALSRTSASGTWCERHVPSTGLPSTSRGPVQPFGVRRISIGQRAAVDRAALARGSLNRIDAVERLVQRRGEPLVHSRRFLAVEAAGDEQRLPAVAAKERSELVFGDPREHRRVRDLVAVEMQDRKHRAVGHAG